MNLWILVATIVSLIALERLPQLRFQALPLLRPYFAGDLFYLLTSGLALSLSAQYAAEHYVAPPRTYAAGAALFACSLAVFDLGGYVSHRLLHRFDLLWEIHKVHHSSRVLDWLATFRGHVLEHVLRQLFSPVLLIAAGVPVAVVGTVAAVHGAWSVLVHSNFAPRMGGLEPLLITPRLHRLHHVVDSTEKNFGVMFSVWDRLAGTLATRVERSGPIGAPGEVETYPQTWRAQLGEPFRRRRQPGDRPAPDEVSSDGGSGGALQVNR